jgi:hypothetical protein
LLSCQNAAKGVQTDLIFPEIRFRVKLAMEKSVKNSLKFLTESDERWWKFSFHPCGHDADGNIEHFGWTGIGISMSGTELEVFGLFDSLPHLDGRVFLGAGTPHPARQVRRDYANQSAADRSLWLGSGPGHHETDLAHVPEYRWRPPVRIHCPKAVDFHSRPGMERLCLLQASSASRIFLVAAATAN